VQNNCVREAIFAMEKEILMYEVRSLFWDFFTFFRFSIFF